MAHSYEHHVQMNVNETRQKVDSFYYYGNMARYGVAPSYGLLRATTPYNYANIKTA